MYPRHVPVIALAAVTLTTLGYAMFAKDELIVAALLACGIVEATILAALLLVPERIQALPRRTKYMLVGSVVFCSLVGSLAIATDRGVLVQPIREYKGDFPHQNW